MLKRLVIEFKDELDALGVKVDQLDARVSVVEDRMGGWKISGELRLDIEDWDTSDGEADGAATLSLARLEFQRWFGEDESIFFYGRVEEGGTGVAYDKFYVDFPFFMDTTATVGRFDRDFEGDYRFQIGGTTDIANDAWLTDRTVDGFGIEKSFNLGSFNFYAAHPGDLPVLDPDADPDLTVWEFAAMAQLQFTEQFGFDIGFQAFLGDDTSIFTDPGASYKVDNLWTIFAGLRFNFTPEIAAKALFYHQGNSIDVDSGAGWVDADLDSASAWKAIVDVKQEALGFTSLWLEYDHLDGEFYLPYSNAALTLTDDGWHKDAGIGFVGADTNIWRVGATQQWNDKWSSWLYVAGHTLEDAGLNAAGGSNDAKALQWGLGVEYQYNENVAFALGYINVDWNDDAERAEFVDDHLIRFRTGIVF
jgi:opacity protein-like surface antigen